MERKALLYNRILAINEDRIIEIKAHHLPNITGTIVSGKHTRLTSVDAKISGLMMRNKIFR